MGVADRLRLTPVNTREEPEKITPVNPLGKIPALITDTGESLYDSPVICEYLDAKFGDHRLLPARGPRRWADPDDGRARRRPARRRAPGPLRARADPPSDNRPSGPRGTCARCTGRSTTWSTAADGFGAELDMGLIGVGCALGYIPLRLLELEGLPQVAATEGLVRKESQRPSFKNTTPVL